MSSRIPSPTYLSRMTSSGALRGVDRGDQAADERSGERVGPVHGQRLGRSAVDPERPGGQHAGVPDEQSLRVLLRDVASGLADAEGRALDEGNGGAWLFRDHRGPRRPTTPRSCAPARLAWPRCCQDVAVEPLVCGGSSGRARTAARRRPGSGGDPVAAPGGRPAVMSSSLTAEIPGSAAVHDLRCRAVREREHRRPRGQRLGHHQAEGLLPGDRVDQGRRVRISRSLAASGCSAGMVVTRHEQRLHLCSK